MDAGHETLIQEAWFAERFWSDIQPGYSSNSIAIQINGNDHYILDSIVWQYTNLGIEINGAANVLMGVHAWGCGQPWCNNLTGIRVASNQNRLIGCYLDYNSLDIVNPSAVVVEASFFLGTHLRLLVDSGHMDGLVAKHNTFSSADPIVVVGTVATASDVFVEENLGPSPKTTHAQRHACGVSSNVSFDLSSTLLAPIDHIQYSLASTDLCPSASSSGPQPVPKVTVSRFLVTFVFEEAFGGSVFVEARCCGTAAASDSAVGLRRSSPSMRLL